MIPFAEFCFTLAAILAAVLTYAALGIQPPPGNVGDRTMRWALIAASGSAAVAFLAMGLRLLS